MARSAVPTALVAALLLLLASAVSVQASYWSDEVTRVRTYAAQHYMDRTAKDPNVSALPSGLLVTILRRGAGDRAPAAEDVCEVHYTIHHRFPGIVDDTRDKPYPVRRSPSQLLLGMAEAMQLMREGDRWFLYVPSKLAYGTEGWKERRVAGLANVRVDLEVLKCENPRGKTSEEIDAYLAPFLKTPMPAKSMPINYADL
ncbi:putative peptidyl-prolyl cis-trans isomerase macrophage infectivity potentiator precursor [Leptomonas pyrrhocoris]|uniref:peptidylprolyl isomerase n=1 Tax=Leptomonas pyrrhocoris TaxID=157538 RepID=A0A0M9G5W9_LEPPY|nr:putative peptidyl-prolyl cis-trans isomerase macrophage infectivity potentiator precursor [Leptomonas pyrrhocoris]XP_015661288.1 putative peptidyl-prolyl cis-trans isomerase macrophage infectivity potentiator precursor [Leptomonas pyrrhocoris]KPA82848.1 putative peptidyl-prolyl cis-trans isomerase macrophage infectivity potentiator precursor [Leptomonas pyrrhocoris]KPA82849.1 putative peptidyl-prolyl cis-trans isomerase macrophage infectivity potentiator precursor [Leptomonas pyrrhocoris]|eukprot:XP_015661287.1 putative peptidyl-prolyl cis-trans isomerase macrophage infectivity potentiator precursor [Leptomonas pyrrhocoris]